MKRLSFFFVAFSLLSVVNISCKKSSSGGTYKCATCQATPIAVAANDNSSKGIYKGVVIGSTGTIQFDVMNNSSAIKATLVLDGQTINLTSNFSWVNGQPVVAPFTGTMNGSAVSITLSVSSTGSAPIVTAANIPGHPNATFLIAKETSTALIECFEGTYHTTKPEDGTFNVILSRQLHAYAVVSRENGQSGKTVSDGSITSDNKIKDGSSGQILGSISGDELSGTFKDSDGKTVTFSGKRTW